jgi:hypothetical protein
MFSRSNAKAGFHSLLKVSDCYARQEVAPLTSASIVCIDLLFFKRPPLSEIAIENQCVKKLQFICYLYAVYMPFNRRRTSSLLIAARLQRISCKHSIDMQRAICKQYDCLLQSCG